MSDVPGGPEGSSPDPWDAWRSWSSPSGGAGGPSAWDAWKTWQWTPGRRPPAAARGAGSSGCGFRISTLFVIVIVVLMLLSSVLGNVAGSDDLPADDLIAAIDALPVTGPRNARPPDAGAGESATFPAPGVDQSGVADQIQAVQVPRQRESSERSTFLLYEEATVAITPVEGGSEVVVFEDNRQATRRFPTILLFPGWSGALDTFDTRARSRGGIGGYRGGGGGLGK